MDLKIWRNPLEGHNIWIKTSWMSKNWVGQTRKRNLLDRYCMAKAGYICVWEVQTVLYGRQEMTQHGS